MKVDIQHNRHAIWNFWNSLERFDQFATGLENLKPINGLIKKRKSLMVIIHVIHWWVLQIGIVLFPIFKTINVFKVCLFCKIISCAWRNTKTFFYYLESSGNVCGLYLQALCTGLDQILEPYRKTLLALEQEASTKLVKYWKKIILRYW